MFMFIPEPYPIVWFWRRLLLHLASQRGIETNEDGSVRCFKMRDGKEIMADEYVSSVPLANEYLWGCSGTK